MGIVKKLGRPITGSRKQMSPTQLRGEAGSLEQAASQIRQAPAPFAGNGGLRNPPPSNMQFRVAQPHGSAAPDLRPGSPHRAAPRSAPPSQATMNQRVGHKAGYRATKPPSDGAPGLKVPKFSSNQDIFSPDVMAKYYGRL